MFSKQMENRLKVESSGQTKTKTASTSPEGGFNKKRKAQLEQKVEISLVLT